MHLILKDDEEIGDKLYILNMDDYTLRMSKIKLSEKSGNIVLSGNKVNDTKLVFGRIRRLFLTKEFVDDGMIELAVDIMRLIAKFYASELLHHIDYDQFDDKYLHRAIPIECVLRI